MTIMSARLTEAAMSALSSRFALGRPHDESTYGTSEADGESARPYGLRFFRPAVAPTGPGVEYRYCPVRQMAVADDGTDEPLITSMMNWDPSTTGQQDGAGKPSEEWKLDYRDDSDPPGA